MILFKFYPLLPRGIQKLLSKLTKIGFGIWNVTYYAATAAAATFQNLSHLYQSLSLSRHLALDCFTMPSGLV